MWKTDKILHGGDYNPEQWLAYPEVLKEDLALMKEAKVNCVSLGIFSWTFLEPEEGVYQFQWLEDIIDRLYENGISVILATPSGGMPMWLSYGYPEVRQVTEERIRMRPGGRHNFCPSSPLMREKIVQMDRKLSEHFGNHKGVIAWHISNEYGGNGRAAACHCPHCQNAFRSWLKEKYETLDNLNHAWWTSFWSHRYTEWEQIESPGAFGENDLHGLNLDWKRFVSDQLMDFCSNEIQAVREYSVLPVTTNMMGFYKPLNYFKWADLVDVISWDCYPLWHSEKNEFKVAARAAATHDIMRSLKKRSFLMMESTPSNVSWYSYNSLKRPGMHALGSLQAVAHGSDSVMYFQWRKGRGGCEKYHGAVLDHKNSSDTRVYREVRSLGSELEKLSSLLPFSETEAKVAMIFDWENWWAIEDAWAVKNKLDYLEMFLEYYYPLWQMGISVDILDMNQSIEEYEVVIAPYNYLYGREYPERIREFVKNGGTYITTCWSGEVDENDLCFVEKHPLQDVLGIRIEETDTPAPWMKNSIRYEDKEYPVKDLCAVIHLEGASVMAEYQTDYYKGFPALTGNRYGDGSAYFVAARCESDLIQKLYEKILNQRGIPAAFPGKLREGITVGRRWTRDGKEILFFQNFTNEPQTVAGTGEIHDLLTGETYGDAIELQPYECKIVSEVK